MRNVSWMLGLSFAICFTTACGDNMGNGDGDDAVDPPDAEMVDAVPFNPPNPDGLGPLAPDLGDTADLTGAGAYVLMAKTGITNVTGSSIVGGHLACSPAVLEAVTGFADTRHKSGEYSTSDSVPAPGKIYASNHTEPTPTNLTTAVLAMEAAYTDAASRTNPDFLNLQDGEIGGETLVPGLYRWGSNVTIPTNVTIAGSATDVWIFQITNDLDVTANMEVVLSGGALPENIFWQVAGQATIHADAHFEGVILSKTGVTLQANATLDGRIYAQSLIALNDNDINVP